MKIDRSQCEGNKGDKKKHSAEDLVYIKSISWMKTIYRFRKNDDLAQSMNFCLRD